MAVLEFADCVYLLLFDTKEINDKTNHTDTGAKRHSQCRCLPPVAPYTAEYGQVQSGRWGVVSAGRRAAQAKACHHGPMENRVRAVPFMVPENNPGLLFKLLQ